MTKVTLIPAHPSYGSVSMLRYWHSLLGEHQPGDPYQLESLLNPLIRAETLQTGSFLRKAISRKLFYPLRTRLGSHGKIAHVLDHSWADMLEHIPAGLLKVITVHDLIPLRFPGNLSMAQRKRFHKIAGSIQTADAIIAVSSYTKLEILHYFDVPEEKIHIIPNGTAKPDEHAESNSFPLKNYPIDHFYKIGSIGSNLERKNLNSFTKALAGLSARIGRPVGLIRAGEILPTPLAEAIQKALGNDGILIELGKLSDQDVSHFYRAVDVMAVPSLYEGFGLPLLEAMSFGSPVVASSSSSLKEVGGDAALYFDPSSPEDFQNCLVQAYDAPTRATLIQRGLIRSQQFTWRKSLESLYSVYSHILAKQ